MGITYGQIIRAEHAKDRHQHRNLVLDVIWILGGFFLLTEAMKTYFTIWLLYPTEVPLMSVYTMAMFAMSLVFFISYLHSVFKHKKCEACWK